MRRGFIGRSKNTGGTAVKRTRLFIALAGLCVGCTPQSDVSFFVLVKSSNYAQDSTGTIALLNYHFFSEIFLEPDAEVEEAYLSGPGENARHMPYEDRGDNFYVEGGHFDTVEELDAKYPNGDFAFNIRTSAVNLENETLALEGPAGRTNIPSPITIMLMQSGGQVSPLTIDPSTDLIIKWSEYSNGTTDPRGVVDDMIFVVVADCHGERLFHTGLPFGEEYLKFQATEVVVSAESLESGQTYSMFVEFPHVVDSRVIDGTPGFTSYATATYLDFHTKGLTTDHRCPSVAPPMDTGQTDRMESDSASN